MEKTVSMMESDGVMLMMMMMMMRRRRRRMRRMWLSGLTICFQSLNPFNSSVHLAATVSTAGKLHGMKNTTKKVLAIDST